MNWTQNGWDKRFVIDADKKRHLAEFLIGGGESENQSVRTRRPAIPGCVDIKQDGCFHDSGVALIRFFEQGKVGP